MISRKGLISIIRKYPIYTLIIIILLTLPIYAPSFFVIQIAYGLIFGITGLAFNLLLGYTGLLSFGHAGFFAFGAYMMSLPIRHTGIVHTLEVYLAFAFITSAALGALLGLICARRTRIFFSILNLSFGLIIYSFFLKFWGFTGGADGTHVPTPPLLGMKFAVDKEYWMTHIYYYYILAAFFICLAIFWVIVNSNFGKTLQAIRDNEIRAQFTGIRIYRYRHIAYIISVAFTGLAGCLWAPLNGHTAPEIAWWTYSGDIVMLTILGGYQYFIGPVIGGLVFNVFKIYTIGYTVYWMLLLGIILLILIFFIPRGLVGLGISIYNRLTHKKGSSKG
ncbi:MAG: branched-chain amino acid ABC transporter permease [Nitrososphaerales archaeon]